MEIFSACLRPNIAGAILVVEANNTGVLLMAFLMSHDDFNQRLDEMNLRNKSK